MLVDAPDAAMDRLPDPADGLAPAEVFLDTFSSYQTKRCDDVDLLEFLPNSRRSRNQIRMRDDTADPRIVDKNVESPPCGDGFTDQPHPVRIIG